MSKTYLLDLAPAINYLNGALAEHVGSAAFTLDSANAADLVLERFFHGSMYALAAKRGLPVTPEELIAANFQVPTDIRRDIAAEFDRRVVETVRSSIPFAPNMHYTYRLDSSGDLYVNEMDMDPASRQSANDTVFREELDRRQAEENGDYVPARLRR